MSDLFEGTSNLKIKYIGGAPLAVHQYCSPKKVRPSLDGKKGAKIFILKGQLIKGSIVDISKNAKKSGLADDFFWATRDEMRQYFRSRLFGKISAITYVENDPTVEEVLDLIKRKVNRNNRQQESRAKSTASS